MSNRRMPAEWELQRSVQLTWPHAATDWAPMLRDISFVYESMAREILKRESLLIVAPEACAPDMEKLAASLPSPSSLHAPPSTLLPPPSSPCLQTVYMPTNDTWARDHGFITVEETGDDAFPSPSTTHSTPSSLLPPPSSRKLLLDFCFNGWGEKFEATLDNQINRRLYDAGAVDGTYESHLDFVLEGGSIESDGKGTVFTTACCLLAPHRNQPLTRNEIEQRLKSWLGARRIVWLEHGSLIGDDTDGHIDTLVRICPDDTLLYTGGDADHPDLQLMEQELRQLRTIDGRPYRLLRLPLPRPVYESGERLPATYANYLVINGAVLMPTYGQPDLDTEAARIIGQAFPGRDIVPIDCRPVIRQHGSLHCCTMQYY